jgi:hypothetical protein
VKRHTFSTVAVGIVGGGVLYFLDLLPDGSGPWLLLAAIGLNVWPRRDR